MASCPHASRASLLLAAAVVVGLLPAGGCGKAPARLAITVPSEFDDDKDKYVDSHVRNPELFPLERDLLARREELLINWATGKTLKGEGAKVRIVAPPLQLTGDENTDATRTYEVILVADELPAGMKFLDEYDVVVAPEQLQATIRPAESANSLYDADLILLRETLDRNRRDRATVMGDKAFAEAFAKDGKARIDAALATAKANLAKYEGEITAATARRDQLMTLGPLLDAYLAREKANEARHNADQAGQLAAKAKRRLEAANDELDQLGGEISLGDLQKLTDARDAADKDLAGKRKAYTDAVAARDVPGLTEEDRKAKQKLVDDASAAVDAATRVLTDAGTKLRAGQKRADAAGRVAKEKERQASATEAAAKAETATTRPAEAAETAAAAAAEKGFGPSAVVTYQLDLSRARQRVDAAEERAKAAQKDVARLELIADPAAIGAAKDQLDVLVTFYEEEEKRLQGLAAADPGGGQYKSDRAVSVRFRAQSLAKVEQIRLEVVRRTALAPPAAPPVAGSRATAGADKGGNPDDGLGGRGPGAESAAVGLIADLRAYDDVMAEARQVLLMTRDSIDKQSQVDYLAHLTSQMAPLLGRLRARAGALDARTATRAAEWLRRAGDTTSPAPPPEPSRVGGDGADPRASVLLVDTPRDTPARGGNGLATEPADKSKPPLAENRRVIADRMNGILAAVTRLPRAAAEMTPETGRARAAELDRGRTDVAILLEALAAADPDAQKAADKEARFVRLITAGDLAVFRLNVLRGVVKTTGYICADDGAALLFGREFANRFYALQVTFRNPQDKPILIYGNTMRFVTRMNSRDPNKRTVDGQPTSQGWWALVQPLNYDAVRRMMVQSQENSWQRQTVKALEVASVALGAGAAFTSSVDFARGAAVFAGVLTPAARELLEADLKRYSQNFESTGLNAIEEIPAQGVITRYVFLPKGPIYGSFAYDVAVATRLPADADSNDRAFRTGADDFGKKALVPVYIHDVRREEVYVEGKRILASDPLTSVGR